MPSRRARSYPPCFATHAKRHGGWSHSEPSETDAASAENPRGFRQARRCWPAVFGRCPTCLGRARVDVPKGSLRLLTAARPVEYCVTVKNITVTVDDETYRRARIRAAEQDTSVSALVRRFLIALAEGESDAERLKREERALRTRIAAFRASDRVPRNEVHARGT
jgi:plasmid stability protein